MSEITLGQIFRWLAPSGTALVTVIGMLWFVAKPHAEDFVKETVNNEKFASQRALDAIDLKTSKQETELQTVKSLLNQMERQQDVMSSQIRKSEELQRESREDIRDILKGVKSLQQ
jgi:septal ring factor EnvC (AmiA/AmiB activator)